MESHPPLCLGAQAREISGEEGEDRRQACTLFTRAAATDSRAQRRLFLTAPLLLKSVFPPS